MKIVFFLCSSLSYGNRTLCQRRNIRTHQEDQLACQAYRCKDEDEFRDLQKLVAKPNSRLWVDIRAESEDGTLHPLSTVLDVGQVIPEAVSLPASTENNSKNSPKTSENDDTVLPTPDDTPPLEPKNIHRSQIVEAVTEKKYKLAELAAKIGVPADELKESIKSIPEIKLRQGGWVTLADAE